MACPVKNFLGKKVIARDLWGKDSIDNISEQVESHSHGAFVAHVRRVRGGWDIKVHQH